MTKNQVAEAMMAVIDRKAKGPKSAQKVEEAFAVKLQRIRSVMPDNLLTELDALASYTNQIRWRLGDAVNKAHDILEQTGQGTLMDACWFVSVQTGEFRAQNTLREYASTAAFFNKRLRRTYRADEIPFSHFLYAKTLTGDYQCKDGRAAPMWEVCLQYSVHWMEQHGYNTTEAKLRDLFGSFEAASGPAGQLFHYPVAPAQNDDGTLVGVDVNMEVAQAETPADLVGMFAARVEEMITFLPIVGAVWSHRKEAKVAKLLREVRKIIESED